MKIPQKDAALLHFITILTHLSSAAAQCDETDALLKIVYSMSDASNSEVNIQDFTRAKQLVIRPSGNVGNSSISEIIDYTLEDLVDYKICVPRMGACLEVALHNFDMDDYEISFDGKTISADDIAVFKGEGDEVIHSAEVGNYCTPICDEISEALFKYDYWSSVGFEDYRVEDKDGNPVLKCDSWEDECQANTFGTMHRTRACLKKDGCYTLLIGDNFQRIPGHSESESEHYISWDDRTVDKRVSRLFESIKFGGEMCEADCNSENESRVELFMHRVTSRYDCKYNPEPDLTWTLRVNQETSANGTIPGCGNSSLYHEAICIPKDACATYTVASPVVNELVAATYTLSMDGVIYKRKEFNVDDTLPEFSGLEDTTIIGNCVGTLCGADLALLEVDVISPSEYIFNSTTSLAAIPGSFSWDLSLDESESWHSSSSFNHPGIDLDTVYRTIECISHENECKYQFNFTSDFEGGKFGLKRNGTEWNGLGGTCDDFENLHGGPNNNEEGKDKENVDEENGDVGGVGGIEPGGGGQNGGTENAGDAAMLSTVLTVLYFGIVMDIFLS